ncbi:ATP-binding cassette domain-containing protein [Mesorhizobium mediterraneum]|uniref:ABC transporter ATP-binding protein n=1 Tax=Mesorhizobium mediterraneum TaxID=43617 RepID=A0AB36REJ2_9HYPH|nr:ATP-binding cassette domain-containing protein [Mesorhizobium mediterraneum]PAQ03013.1 ABC transporter ATP-binding protein [Mesorhizobium mediterraneum]RWN44918.1 MAG: ATP-binding cassette domain-containing protein [Mesorhizobium sp.]WIW53393.1 ATP-binding cassette domain-containing protein [Mesorhizobium mediterraneum]
MTEDRSPIFECRNVTVRYGHIVALSDVGAVFERGMIHAVVGQNGAGKTTFARVLAGLVRPASGELKIDGRPLAGGNVRDARRSGVELVHQSFALPPSFTVAEAMQFGAEGGGLFTKAALEKRWQHHLDALHVKVKAKQRIRDLPVETQQSVEIARALVSDAKLLILDEPTAVLSPEGAEKLFDRVRRLKERGVTVILILHKIREVLAIADTVAVLRGGKLVDGPLSCDGIDADRLAELIIGPAAARNLSSDDKAALTGAAVITHAEQHVADTDAAAPVLKMRAVSTRRDPEGPALDEISLEVRPGEIVGVAGVEGNGQRTLVRAISALADVVSGDISIDRMDVTRAPLAARRAAGLRVIPFERNVEGLSLTSSLWENWSARGLLQRPLLSAISPSALRKQCDTALKQWDVRYSDVGQRAGSLSGGNAQKVILSREMDENARLILAAQPTRGLDIGATSFVWQSMLDARARGCGLLFISSDLDEIFDISDRVVVMLSGRIVAEFRPPYDITAVGAAMTGVLG